MLNILSSLFAIDCCWTPTESSRHPHTSVSVLSRLQFSHQMPGLMWAVTKVRPVLRWSRPGPAAASSVLVTGWLRHEAGHIGHLVTRPGPRGPGCHEEQHDIIVVVAVLISQPMGLCGGAWQGQGVHSMNDILRDRAWETPCASRGGLRLWLCQAPGLVRLRWAESHYSGDTGPWQHLQSQLRVIITCHFTPQQNVTRHSSWAAYSWWLHRSSSSGYTTFKLARYAFYITEAWPEFSRHQVWMFARPSESKLVAGRFACCVSYLGNCCHAISGGRVKHTITIKTPRMIKDFQEIFSFLFFNFFTVSSWALQ